MEKKQIQKTNYIGKRFHGEGTTQNRDIHREKTQKRRDYIWKILSEKKTIKKANYIGMETTWGIYYIRRRLYKKEIT